MTTVTVTGASGKLGRHVGRDLHEHGYRVVALDRVPDAARRRATTSRPRRHLARRAPQDHLTDFADPLIVGGVFPPTTTPDLIPFMRRSYASPRRTSYWMPGKRPRAQSRVATKPVEDSTVLFATLERYDDDRLLF